jgi:hypothetical protein
VAGHRATVLIDDIFATRPGSDLFVDVLLTLQNAICELCDNELGALACWNGFLTEHDFFRYLPGR